MCGIAGIYYPAGIDPGVLVKISDVIRHRGPDDEGFMVVNDKNEPCLLRGKQTIPELGYLPAAETCTGPVKLAFIHRRLSIIDLTPAGHQPMMMPEAGLSIVYNGEVYNYIELREELRTFGYSFVSESDTEVILNSYRQWSEKCVDHFIGMWAFAILDRNRNVLFCSRDRFGIKPFYYYEEPGLFAFASEIKALFSLPQVKPVPDETKAIEFLVNSNMNFHGATFFRGINELPQGHNMIYDLGSRESSVSRYYRLPSPGPAGTVSRDEAVKKFSELIDSSISIHLRSDVPVGSCLSGGLDSGTILTRLAGSNLPYGVSTFTAAFPGNNVDETAYVKALRKRYNFSDYYTYPDLDKVMNEADLFLWHQELPVQSTSMFAQWEVMKLAHQHSVKVLLDGQGMDEILGGYSEFTGSYLLGKLSHGHIAEFMRAYRELKENYKTSSVNNELFRALFYYLPPSLRNRVYSYRRIGPSVISKDYNDVLRSVRFETRISNSMRETSVMSINNILPALLRYEDRSSMAFSVESRVPYLDHRLAEFCVSLPDDLKIYRGWTKYILRKSSEPYLPAEITWRKEKLGFVTPERLWTEQLKNQLNTFVQDNKIPAIIDKNILLGRIANGTNNSILLGEIWKIILFIKWYNVFKLRDNQ